MLTLPRVPGTHGRRAAAGAYGTRESPDDAMSTEPPTEAGASFQLLRVWLVMASAATIVGLLASSAQPSQVGACATRAFSFIRLPGVKLGLSPRSLLASPRGSPWTSFCRCERGCRAKLSSCPQLCWRSEFPCSSYGRTFAAVPPDALDPTAAQPDHLRAGAGGRRLAAMMSSPQKKATWSW